MKRAAQLQALIGEGACVLHHIAQCRPRYPAGTYGSGRLDQIKQKLDTRPDRLRFASAC